MSLCLCFCVSRSFCRAAAVSVFLSRCSFVCCFCQRSSETTAKQCSAACHPIDLMRSGAVAGVTMPEPKAHPWVWSAARASERDDETVSQLSGDRSTHAADRGITSAGGHGYRLPNGSSLASAGLDSNCNLAGGSVDSRPGPSLSLSVSLCLSPSPSLRLSLCFSF